MIYLVNRPDSIASFRAHAAKISIIAPQTFSIDLQGRVFVGSYDIDDDREQITSGTIGVGINWF